MFHALMLALHLANPNFHVGDLACDVYNPYSLDDNEFLKPVEERDLLIRKVQKVGKRNYLYVVWDSYGQHWIADPMECKISIGDDCWHTCTKEELKAISYKE